MITNIVYRVLDEMYIYCLYYSMLYILINFLKDNEILNLNSY